jgi:hypothetical protein
MGETFAVKAEPVARGPLDPTLGLRIRAGEVLLDDLFEDRLIRIGLSEKCHGGSELDRVDPAEDLLRAESLMGGDELGAFHQPRPEHRMCQVGPGLRKIADRVCLGHGTAPEPCDLREDEPHPVTGLAPVSQLRDRSLVRAAAVLRPDETLEIHAGDVSAASVGLRLQLPE